MSRWDSYLLSATKVINAYKGDPPLHHFLKAFFKQHPQMGSRDRRWISQLVYHYYRLGWWQRDKDVAERLLLGTFLCETTPNDLLAQLKPEWNAAVGNSIEEKLQLSGNGALEAAALFPFADELSEGIDANAFAKSYLQQPHFYIRIRNNKQDKVLGILDKAGINYQLWDNKTTLALPNGTKIEDLLPEKSWYEVQDASSQQTGLLFKPRRGERWWDCCAASGGKSILLKDQEPGVQLLVSDVRRSILENLQKRFAAAGVKNYEERVADLTNPAFPGTMGKVSFDGIILDAPCSGSGTWGRTPENLSFFKKEEISKYADLQKRIAANVVSFVKPGGSFIYITCSVFRQENEDVVDFIEANSDLKRQEGGIITGYGNGADTMFAVKFTR
ncbi:Fmu (Sun) domain-containing protein [Chitinophaga sp. Hz27]|uniref:Fmu (Sun) domain-containing protein n=1 Tax=Chitinophaga sp. Hz27 TaxID=3347169 RepID=UPI0035D5821F